MGWFLTSLAWSYLRGGQVSWDPQVRDALNNGLLSQDFAATNLAVGAGAVSSNKNNKKLKTNGRLVFDHYC